LTKHFDSDDHLKAKANYMETLTLTENEMKILRCIAGGHSHRQIGKRLFKSKKTIDAWAVSLRSKLGASNNANLVDIAYRMRILMVEE
jgi:DNA-binding NarL/FixJ family response regulator